MNLSDEDKQLLAELCSQHQVNYQKVIKLLDVEQEFEVKERRTGIYDALREVVKSSFNEAEET